MTNHYRSVIGTVLVTLAFTSACAPTRTRETVGETVDDKVIETRIKADLIVSPVTKAHQIDVIARRGEVQLSGFVDSESSRAEAERIARQVAGVQHVHNELMLRDHPETAGAVIDDSAITVKVNAALIADADTKAREIHVRTVHGVVELAGYVDSLNVKDKASRLASSVSGVRDVVNRLEIKRN